MSEMHLRYQLVFGGIRDNMLTRWLVRADGDMGRQCGVRRPRGSPYKRENSPCFMYLHSGEDSEVFLS